MKFIVAILLHGFLAFALGLYSQFPWWLFVATSGIVAFFIMDTPAKSFFAGFLGLGALWAGLAFGKDLANAHLLSSKVAQILPLGGSYVALIAVTGVVGGLLGGFSALTGAFMRSKSTK
ncbi:MAG: hypothetical protein NTW77_04180 [Bacteroidetes bacterium]|nr:hypothetical protein [Bacteroidota bacterium]